MKEVILAEGSSTWVIYTTRTAAGKSALVIAIERGGVRKPILRWTEDDMTSLPDIGGSSGL